MYSSMLGCILFSVRPVIFNTLFKASFLIIAFFCASISFFSEDIFVSILDSSAICISNKAAACLSESLPDFTSSLHLITFSDPIALSISSAIWVLASKFSKSKPITSIKELKTSFSYIYCSLVLSLTLSVTTVRYSSSLSMFVSICVSSSSVIHGFCSLSLKVKIFFNFFKPLRALSTIFWSEKVSLASTLDCIYSKLSNINWSATIFLYWSSVSSPNSESSIKNWE